MLLADLQSEAAPPLVDPGLLEGAISAIDKIAAERGLLLSNKKRAKLVALLYQYYLLDKAEGEATAYLSQLMELVSNN